MISSYIYAMGSSVRKRYYRSAATAVMVLLLASCGITQYMTDTKDMSYLYNPSRNVYTPYFTITNYNAETSMLKVGIRKSELYFSEANPEGVPMASLLASARLYDNSLDGVLADTATYKFDVRQDEVGGMFTFSIPLRAYDGHSYTAELKIIDLIRQRTQQRFIDFRRTGPYSGMNYIIRDHFTGGELFSHVVKHDQFFNVLAPSLQPDTLWLFYYKPVTAIPPSPSTILPEVTVAPEPEAVVALPWTDTLPLMLPADGIYMFSVDSLIREGLILCNFGPDHPTMARPETMIPPLAYIATPQEMEEMMTAAKPKLALDKFWLDRTGSIERSKELIKIYYNRTLFANYYFTSYKAGWLTDRGMIYVLYGPPDKVYKNAQGESWGYARPKTKSRWGARHTTEDRYLWFNFRKQESLFSDNDFVLNRAGTPVSYWDLAVARWRQGIVFRLDNPGDLQ